MRYAIYSKTSATPSPVLAEVKKSLGPRSRGSGRGGREVRECRGDSDDDDDGSRLFEVLKARSRAYMLGVIVSALAELVLAQDGVLSLRCLKLDVGLVGSGDERAEW